MIGHQLSALSEGTPNDLANFRRHLPMSWIEDALAHVGKATVRRRRLPSEQVVWLVLGMAMFRNQSVGNVVKSLELALTNGPKVNVAKSSLAKARQRVGHEPLKHLFEVTAKRWSRHLVAEHDWRGLGLYAIDGTFLDVADTEKNEEEFGRHHSGKSAAPAAFPQLRLVCLLAVRARILVAATHGRQDSSEVTLAQDDLIPLIPDDSLTIVDRLYVNSPTLLPLMSGGRNRHFLSRLKKNAKWTIERELGDGDFLVTVPVTWEARTANPDFPKFYRARVVTYGKGFLLTSLCDSDLYPAAEVRDLYHERWEIELGYNELKTGLLEQRPSLRSKLPTTVKQELWGLLIAYNLVRYEIANIATEAKVSPNRISFAAAVAFITTAWLRCDVTSPGTIPGYLKKVRRDVTAFVLPKRRVRRPYPRAVKKRDSKYPRKKSK